MPLARALLLAGGMLVLVPAARALDLRQSVDMARAHDPTLQAAHYGQAAGQESARQATALYLPQINATGGLSHVHVNTSSSLAVGPATPSLVGDSSGRVYGFGITLTQPIYNAAVTSGARQLRSQAELADIQLQGARQNLILRVAQSYFGVLMAEDSLELTREQRAAIAQQLASAQARFKEGKANITDVRDAQARDQGMAAQEIAAKNNLEVQREQFVSLVGAPATALARVSDDFKPAPPEPDDIQDWIVRGRVGNPNVLSARVQIAIAEANVDKNRVYNRPQLNFVLSYQDTRQSGDLPVLVAPDRSRQTVAGLQLNVPLFAGGAHASALRQTIDQKSQADYQLQATIQSSDVQIRQQFLGVDIAGPQIDALKKAVVAAKSSLDATRLGLEVGVRTTLDVLNAQQQYFSALLNLDTARYQYLVSRLNLAGLVGTLDERDVKAVNEYLSEPARRTKARSAHGATSAVNGPGSPVPDFH